MRMLIWPSGSDGSASAGNATDCGALAARRPKSIWRCGLVVPGHVTTSRRRIVGARPFTWNATVGACPGVSTVGLIVNACNWGRAATLDGLRLGSAAGGLGFAAGCGGATGSPYTAPPFPPADPE